MKLWDLTWDTDQKFSVNGEFSKQVKSAPCIYCFPVHDTFIQPTCALIKKEQCIKKSFWDQRSEIISFPIERAVAVLHSILFSSYRRHRLGIYLRRRQPPRLNRVTTRWRRLLFPNRDEIDSVKKWRK